jgi:D-alanine-D-alanine ligase
MAKRRFQKVAVLMGGPSAERDVSLRSGAAVTVGLCQKGYWVHAIDVTSRRLRIPAGVEAVFIALHGEFGEDGELQAVLDGKGLPYTGSGPAASRASFDKVACKRILEAAGIPTAAWEVVPRGGRPARRPPAVVKPPRQGSSIGVSRVRRAAEWRAALAAARKYGDDVLVEEYLPGAELTVGLVGRDVLPVIEVRARGGSYDYRAKYTPGFTQYLCPAPIRPALARACQALAQRTFAALGCRGMGRVDLRLTAAGAPRVLEMNTIPGFTATSLLPKAAAAAGVAFPDLCERVLNLAGLGDGGC